MEIESSPRRSSFGNSSSPEFEFWMVGNNHPELEEPNLLTADELFVDGVLLPLHLLPLTAASKPGVSGVDMRGPTSEFKSEREPEQETEVVESPPVPVPAAGPAAHPEASICSSTAPLTSSKRWKDIFKVGEKKREPTEEKEKKKERKAGNGGNGTAELNINIWPFSRSRSAGTATAGRPKAAAAAEAMRKSSSAPCSRSNSRGENSGGRRWAASPGRPGVHVGRASPVWQARRAGRGPGRAGPREKGPRNLNGGVRGLNLNVNSCIGYMSHHQQSCRREESDGGGAAAAAAASGSSGLFRIRALFSKKEY